MTYREKFQEGLLDVCQFLALEMKQFLEIEGRFGYRVGKYWETIAKQNSEMNKKVSEDDIDFYGRVLFLLRKSIYSEFHYLRIKRMSPADCVITIIHRILDYSERLGNFRFTKEQKKIKEVIDPLWENIRHSKKELSLKLLTGKMNSSIEGEVRGTLGYHELDLLGIETPKQRVQELKRETKFYAESKTREVVL
jgi:hypothetical protein